MKMTQQEKQNIVSALSKRGANRPCPRCNHENFTLLDGYFNQTIHQEVTANLVVGGPSIPSVVIVCNNCGYMSQHALGVLGLLPKNEEKK